MRITGVTAGYFFIQAAAVGLWWVGVLVSPTVARAFFPERLLPDAASLFLLPDLVCVGFGSLLAGVLQLRRSRLAQPCGLLVAGGLAYATLFCVSATLMTGEAAAAVGAMVPATVVSLLMCRYLAR